MNGPRGILESFPFIFVFFRLGFFSASAFLSERKGLFEPSTPWLQAGRAAICSSQESLLFWLFATKSQVLYQTELWAHSQ